MKILKTILILTLLFVLVANVEAFDRRRKICVTPGNNFSPDSIPGLVLWADAERIQEMYVDSGLTTNINTSNSTVGGWKDRSRELNHLLNPVAAGGLWWVNATDSGFGYGAVASDASETFDVLAPGDFDMLPGEPHTHFMAVVVYDFGPAQYIASSSLTFPTSTFNGFGWDCMYDGGVSKGVKYGLRDRSNNLVTATISDNIDTQPTIISAVNNWTTLKLYKNGVLKDTKATTGLTANIQGNQIYRVSASGTGGLGMQGFHFVHLFYRRALTPMEHNLVGQWLAKKLNLFWTSVT